MANNPLIKSFSKWRILIPVVIGLAITSRMIYQSVSQTTFVKVEEKTGNYKWVDSNGNKTLDIHDESHFIPVPQGDYNLESFNSILDELRIEPSFSVETDGGAHFVATPDNASV